MFRASGEENPTFTEKYLILWNYCISYKSEVLSSKSMISSPDSRNSSNYKLNLEVFPHMPNINLSLYI